MKTIIFLLVLVITFSLQAQTVVTDNDYSTTAELSKTDSEILYNALNAPEDITGDGFIKSVATMDYIANLTCAKTSTYSCFLYISKLPGREQSTTVRISAGYVMAQVQNYHDGKRLYSSYQFDEIRGNQTRARFFFTHDMKVMINCINSLRADSYTCEFGIR